MRHAHLWAILIAVAIAAPAEGWARPPSAKERAKALFKAGKAAYAKKDYKEAAARFTAAYELDPVPAALLNIAQSYRSTDDFEMAARYYQKYLEAAPGSPLKAQVEELLREARAKLEKPRPRPDLTPGPGPGPGPASEPSSMLVTPQPETPPTETRPIYKRWWFWTVIAAVVVGTSVGVGVYAGTREPDYVKEGGLGSVRW